MSAWCLALAEQTLVLSSDPLHPVHCVAADQTLDHGALHGSQTGHRM